MPARGDGAVVLLARDTPASAPAVRDLGVDLTRWQPVVEERAFVPWLLRPPGEAQRLRARRLTPAQIGEGGGGGRGWGGAWLSCMVASSLANPISTINCDTNRQQQHKGALEELWKTRPDASLDDLDSAAGADGGGAGGAGAAAASAAAKELTPVALRYDDAAQYEVSGVRWWRDRLAAMTVAIDNKGRTEGEEWGSSPAAVNAPLHTNQAPEPLTATPHTLSPPPIPPPPTDDAITPHQKAVFRPLIQAEADHDRALHEAQRRDGVAVRWDTALNGRRLALFHFPQDDAEVRLLPGDELRLRHAAAGARGAWEGTGYVVGGAGAALALFFSEGGGGVGGVGKRLAVMQCQGQWGRLNPNTRVRPDGSAPRTKPHKTPPPHTTHTRTNHTNTRTNKNSRQRRVRGGRARNGARRRARGRVVRFQPRVCVEGHHV